jgi:hypothetical protein
MLSLILKLLLIKGTGLLFPRKSYTGTSRKMTALIGQNNDIKYLVLNVNKNAMKHTISWNVMLYSLVEVYPHDREMYCLHHQGLRVW